MSLLDELKQEAKRISQDSDYMRSQEELQQAFYKEQTQPALQRIYVYLNDLREQLNQARPVIAASYDIPDIGSVDTLARDYVVRIDSSNSPTNVGFIYTAAASAPKRGKVRIKKTADEVRDILSQTKQKFEEWPIRGTNGIITAIGFEFTLMVPVGVYFLADLPNRSVQMISTNLEGFRTFRHSMKPAKVDDAWLDKLGRYIVRRGPDPSILILSDAEREKIRYHLRKINKHQQLTE